MYEFRVRPETNGRTLVSQQQHPGSRFYSKTFNFFTLFSESSGKTSMLRQFAPLCLLGVLTAVTSGCGRYNNSLTSSSQGVHLNGITCGTQSLTGPQTKTCSLSLSSVAVTAATVQLTSNSPALKVPASVKIAVGQNSTSFDAVTTAVSKAATVTITASYRGATKIAAVTLYPVSASATPSLSSISCATQSLTGPATTACTVHISSAAPNPIAVTLTSSSSAVQIPQAVTVVPGSSAAAFNATASAVASTQKVTLSAASAGVIQTYIVNLVGSSTQASQQHRVELSWTAPGTSTATIVGYNIYRAITGVSSYALLSSLDAQTSYADTGVQSGSTYDYIVKSVDSKGMESTPSNSTRVTIP